MNIEEKLEIYKYNRIIRFQLCNPHCSESYPYCLDLSITQLLMEWVGW